MAELETKKKTSSSSIMPDWSQLPDELLPLISKHLEENCFDVIHARSVCRIWRSSFPFPSSLLHPGYTIPQIDGYTINTIEKVPMFLFRVPDPDADAPEYLLVGISRDESEDHMELPSPLQCSVKFKIRRSEPTLMNVLDCQVIPLGYEYRINKLRRFCCAMLQLNNEGEFVVLLDGTRGFLVFRSTEMRWIPLKETSTSLCRELFTFRGKFYATFFNGDIFVIDPYSLEATALVTLTPNNKSHSLVPSGNDELFLFEFLEILAIDKKIPCRVSRLDAEAGKWVVVSD